MALVRFRQARGIHVANKDRTATLHKTGAKFVLKIFPAVGNFCTDCLHVSLLDCALDIPKLYFPTPVKPLCFDVFQRIIRKAGKRLQAQVDTKTGLTDILGWLLNLYGHVQVPASAWVFRNSAGAKSLILEAVTVAQGQHLSLELDVAIAVDKAAFLNGILPSALRKPGELG